MTEDMTNDMTGTVTDTARHNPDSPDSPGNRGNRDIPGNPGGPGNPEGPVPARPRSATHGAVGAAGFVAFLLSLILLRAYRPFGDDMVASALFMVGMTSATVLLVDLLWQKTYRRASTGLSFERDDPSWSRTLVKFTGLLGSLGFVALLYWLFPEYHGDFYDRYYRMLTLIMPPLLVLALPYLYFVDRRMPQPLDGYWHVGQLVTLQWANVDRRIVGQHLLGWLVKGFFLPLMFGYLCNDLARFLSADVSQLSGFKPWFDLLYGLCYFVDVGLTVMGYLLTLRLADTHLRSAEPTMLGWAVALACYEPFWSLIGRQYLHYDTGFAWGEWLWGAPLLYGIWGSAILLLTMIYVWATVSFGGRFSNLTHRGIITNGPYRWTKHPAYVAKNLSWWLIFIPFVARGPVDEALRHCLLLLGVNGLYAMRAWTEERHLSRDPVYVAYARWIDAHGLFRFLPNLSWFGGRWRTERAS
ncbi:isoprenylcysteine carboxylmethyltransferase family protein [Pandoraea sp. PE-S2T-3]|uniref:isoprenylcysteine carboxylmethyltransferase family protein n=1 Tax=Pandoraea sp. PE-S2T-3 TaxID=1986993 RepID=UPI000B3FDF15|nr:isoprenylcysteine carboxylmethyltransferase family protein [Pandoraea sp. PE-S2T-3]